MNGRGSGHEVLRKTLERVQGTYSVGPRGKGVTGNRLGTLGRQGDKKALWRVRTVSFVIRRIDSRSGARTHDNLNVDKSGESSIESCRITDCQVVAVGVVEECDSRRGRAIGIDVFESELPRRGFHEPRLQIAS